MKLCFNNEVLITSFSITFWWLPDMHNDIMPWSCYLHYWPFMLGITCKESTGHHWISLTKGQQCRHLMLSLLPAQTNCWTNNWVASDSGCHLEMTHDIHVMYNKSKCWCFGRIISYGIAHDNNAQHWTCIDIAKIKLLFQWWTMVSPTQLWWRYHSLPLSQQNVHHHLNSKSHDVVSMMTVLEKKSWWPCQCC